MSDQHGLVEQSADDQYDLTERGLYRKVGCAVVLLIFSVGIILGFVAAIILT